MENLQDRYTTILSIAGSDSSSGAGIQADIKTAQLMGVYCMTAITSVTAQCSVGVKTKFDIPVEIVVSQIEQSFIDEPPLAVKTGMLPTPETIRQTANAIDRIGVNRLVVDPVLISSSGTPLCEPLGQCAEEMLNALFPLATLVTPNIPEATYLCGGTLPPLNDLPARLNTHAVLLKGGHSGNDKVNDILITRDNVIVLEGARIESSNTHGTGCVLSSAITSLLAKGMSLTHAVARAKEFITRSIAVGASYCFGIGYGPLYLLPNIYINNTSMNIIINGLPVHSPKKSLSIADALELIKISRQGTAVAVNNRLCKAQEWEKTFLNEGDELTVISATFGG